MEEIQMVSRGVVVLVRIQQIKAFYKFYLRKYLYYAHVI